MKVILEKPLEQKNVFEMSPDELRQRIAPIADEARQKAWDHNTYISYYDEALCPDVDTLVNEYKDRKELVHVDAEGNSSLIKIL